MELSFHVFQRIAFIRRNGFGDLLCAYPTLLYLKDIAPTAEITLFVDSRNAPLIPYLSQIQNVAVFSKGNKYMSLLKTAWKYRTRKFDLAISAKTSPMKLMNFFLYALGAKKRVAYCDSSWHSMFVNYKIPSHLAPLKHQAIKTLHLIAPHFISLPKKYYPKLSIPPEIEALMQASITQLAPSSSEKITLIISATTTNPNNSLNPFRYAHIVNQLAKNFPLHVIVVGQEKDKKRGEEIKSALHLSSSLYFPRNFDEFMVLLKRSDLLFVGDGGPAHIGAALEKGVVALFGGVDPLVWAPLGDHVHVLFHPQHVDLIEESEILKQLNHECERLMYDKRNY